MFVRASIGGGVSRVVDLEVRALRIRPARDRPDAPIAVAGHHVENRQLALQHVVVARKDGVFAGLRGFLGVDVSRIAPDEGQERAIAVGGVAVGDPVALEPMAVLVDDGLPQVDSGSASSCAARRRRARGR